MIEKEIIGFADYYVGQIGSRLIAMYGTEQEKYESKVAILKSYIKLTKKTQTQ